MADGCSNNREALSVRCHSSNRSNSTIRLRHWNSGSFVTKGKTQRVSAQYSYLFDGTFKSDQDVIPVLIQKNADQYVGPSDLLQKWKSGVEYIFLEAKVDVDELASFMKANEMDGEKSVHFVFANSPPEGPQPSNHIAINLSGFSNGFDAFQKACASSQ